MFKRAATELLSLREDDLQSVLLATAHSKKEDISEALKKFTYFNTWSEEQIKRCCILAYIKRYMPQSVIADASNTNHGYTFFIIDGECCVIQKLNLQIKCGIGGRRLFSIKQDGSSNQGSESETNTKTGPGINSNENVIFVTIRTFKRGDCFGLGENLKNRWVVATKAVRCLIIPRDFLLQHNQNNIWPRLRQKITTSFPTDLLIHKSIIQQVKWYEFKSELNRYWRTRKLNSGTTFEDVPWHWRICTTVPSVLVRSIK